MQNSLVSCVRQNGRLLSVVVKQAACFSSTAGRGQSNVDNAATPTKKPVSTRIVEFRKRLRATTPLRQLEELSSHPFQEQQPLKPWPNNTNPHTGEIGGPAGPEPTRYGDWERKGRVSDF